MNPGLSRALGDEDRLLRCPGVDPVAEAEAWVDLFEYLKVHALVESSCRHHLLSSVESYLLSFVLPGTPDALFTKNSPESTSSMCRLDREHPYGGPPGFEELRV